MVLLGNGTAYALGRLCEAAPVPHDTFALDSHVSTQDVTLGRGGEKAPFVWTQLYRAVRLNLLSSAEAFRRHSPSKEGLVIFGYQ